MNADSFGGGLQEGFFFLGQAVERIHQLVQFPLQRGGCAAVSGGDEVAGGQPMEVARV